MPGSEAAAEGGGSPRVLSAIQVEAVESLTGGKALLVAAVGPSRDGASALVEALERLGLAKCRDHYDQRGEIVTLTVAAAPYRGLLRQSARAPR